MAFHESDDYRANYQPLVTIGGYPFFSIQLIVLGHVAAMIVTALLGATSPTLTFLMFWSEAVWRGWIWQLATYALVQEPSIWFAVAALAVFFTFGPGVERFVGRKVMTVLYAGLLLIPPAVLTLVGLITPTAYSGCEMVFFGIFLGFCTIYPNAVFNFFFAEISFKMAAWILLAILSLMYLYAHQPTSLMVLWTTAAVAHFGLRSIGVAGGFGRFGEWWEQKRVAREAKRRKLEVVRERKRERSIDEVLDKISREGIGSLTREERAVLERARSDLMRRDGKS